MSEESDSESQTETIKSNELKKQNDILNRREARRRKILENAKTRLGKLSGEDAAAGGGGVSIANNRCNNHSTETYSDPEIDYPEFVNNYNPTYTTQQTNNIIPNHVDWSNSPLLNNLTNNNNNNNFNPTKQPPTKFEKILSTRVHIVAASPLTYLMLVLGLSVLIPHVLFLFMTLECLELVIFRLDRPLSPIENVILMLCGINMAKAKVLIKVVGLLNKLVCDLGLFLFVFIMTHGLYSWLVEETVDEMFNSF
ncbi:uncharacterized protein LOC129918414 [Episyrphus balteatus]|uniref:uncharacterized protein LOC129918414 n=1 Tax=Episyrphus balteatus TaxID=286459 RepID=UPI0024864BF0|nr:uncharacterized protein LOC129918414 [Episyrphus balteatus]